MKTNTCFDPSSSRAVTVTATLDPSTVTAVVKYMGNTWEYVGNTASQTPYCPRKPGGKASGKAPHCLPPGLRLCV